MDKITALEKAVNSYQAQRRELNEGLLEMTHSEPNAMEKRQAIEMQIGNIDMQITNILNLMIN